MRNIRFTKAKHKLIKPFRKSANSDMLDRLNGYLAQEEPETVIFLLHDLEGLPNTVTYKELREAYLAGEITEEELRDWQVRYAQMVEECLQQKWEEISQKAAEEYQEQYPTFVYDPATSQAMAYIREHGAELVTNMAIEQKNALNAMIAHIGGYTMVTPDEAARMMRACIGLTAPQALANLRYRESIKDAYLKAHPHGKPETAEKKAKEAAARYAARQHRYRAQMIARTELVYAYNAGHHGAIKDAQAQGYIGDCKKKWVTAYDERVCEVCSSMDGETVGMDDRFSNGTLLPPAHPNCRCAVAYEEIEGTNLRPMIGESEGQPLMEVEGIYTGERQEDEIGQFINPAQNDSLINQAQEGTMETKPARGLAAGESAPQDIGHEPPEEIGKIDPNDPKAIRMMLMEWEDKIANEPIENAIVACRDGTLVRCRGDLNGVYPDADLGERLIGAYMTHNHPIGSNNEYTFSGADIALFDQYKLALLRGIDEKYTYELTRDPKRIDKIPSLTEVMKDNELAAHGQTIAKAKARRIGYIRRKRK